MSNEPKKTEYHLQWIQDRQKHAAQSGSLFAEIVPRPIDLMAMSCAKLDPGIDSYVTMISHRFVGLVSSRGGFGTIEDAKSFAEGFISGWHERHDAAEIPRNSRLGS